MTTPSTPAAATRTPPESSRASTPGCSSLSPRICIPRMLTTLPATVRGPDDPAARQHPDVPPAGRHVRADRGQRPRLLLLAARRALARRPGLAPLHLPAAGVGRDPVRDHPPRRPGADRP